MELDKRIKDIKDIKTIITADENDVGKMGYFANSVDYFKDLKKLNGLKYGKLLFLSSDIDKSDMCFVCDNHWTYRYFIPEGTLKPIETEKAPSKKEREEDQDRLDFCKIFLGCSSWDSNGNLQPGQWSKLDKIKLPFSKERAMYLLGKFIFRLDPKDNPRVDK